MAMEASFINQGIAFYEHGLSDELCDEIWDSYFTNIAKSHEGITMSGSSVLPNGTKWKNTFDQSVDDADFAGDRSAAEERAVIDEKIYQSLGPVVTNYLDTFTYLSDAPNIKDTGYLWQMYKQNDGYYKEHIDGEPWTLRVFNRVGAIICYINTVVDGGETYFRYQDLKIKPVKGGVAIFPSSWMYPHEALVPLSSDKLIISSFLTCSPRDFHVHEA